MHSCAGHPLQSVPWEFEELVWPVSLLDSAARLVPRLSSHGHLCSSQWYRPDCWVSSVLILSGEIKKLQAWMLPLTSWLGFRRADSSTLGVQRQWAWFSLLRMYLHDEDKVSHLLCFTAPPEPLPQHVLDAVLAKSIHWDMSPPYMFTGPL